jgi:hypothetical protein
MPPPLIGAWTVEVLAVRPFTIHGDLYYELHVADPDQPGQTVAVRVPRHALQDDPQAGERYTVTFLMGQVTSAQRL